MSGYAPLAMIIDDERDIRAVAGAALRNAGWEVREAADGRAGLELLREGLPRLVVVDLMMTGMSGLELCHKLLGLPGADAIAVLLISGINEKAKLLQDFWQLPLKRKKFLRKPFDVEAFLRDVQELVPDYKMDAPVQHTHAQTRPGRPAGATSGPPTPPPWMQPSQPTPSIHATGNSTLQPPAAPLAPTPKKMADEDHKKGYRVLIVDDEPDIRMIMDTALSMYHTTAQAENGMEALKVLDEFYPDFVLSDINMPVMNGLETAEAIRRHPLMGRVPIFFLTAERSADMPKRSYDVGGNLFLRKPVDPFRLLSYLDYFLNETKLEPELYWKQRNAKRAAEPKPPTSHAAAGAQPALRTLLVDFNIENHKLLKRMLGDGDVPGLVAGGPFETLWTDDPRTALGNLARWQPDLIFYNPRNPGFDGVAFGQTLRLQKVMDQQIVLIGSRFYEADTQYAEKVLKLPPIDIGASESELTRKLGDVLQVARRKIKPKQITLAALLADENDRQREMQKASAKTAREREVFRQRYSKIQEFIDKHYE